MLSIEIRARVINHPKTPAFLKGLRKTYIRNNQASSRGDMMKYAVVWLLSSILAVSTVAAAITGDWGRRMMHGGGTFWGFFSTLFFIGLFLLVWLAVIKLWRGLFGKHKK